MSTRAPVSNKDCGRFCTIIVTKLKRVNRYLWPNVSLTRAELRSKE